MIFDLGQGTCSLCTTLCVFMLISSAKGLENLFKVDSCVPGEVYRAQILYLTLNCDLQLRWREFFLKICLVMLLFQPCHPLSMGIIETWGITCIRSSLKKAIVVMDMVSGYRLEGPGFDHYWGNFLSISNKDTKDWFY